MNTNPQLVAVLIFVFFFVVDVWFHIEPQWYLLLAGLVSLLFKKEPTKAIIQIVKALKSNTFEK